MVVTREDSSDRVARLRRHARMRRERATWDLPNRDLHLHIAAAFERDADETERELRSEEDR